MGWLCIVINPFEGSSLIEETRYTELPAFTLENVHDATIENNIVIRRYPSEATFASTASTEIDTRGNTSLIDTEEVLEMKVREWTADHDSDAAAIIEKVRAELRRMPQ